MSSRNKLGRSVPIAPKERRQPANRRRRQVDPTRFRKSGITPPTISQGAVFRHHWILWAGPVLMLVAALFPWPYGYYNFLRFCVCGAAAFLAYQQWTHDNAASKWVVALVGIALLYNPLIPIHLTREIWTVANVGTAIAFVGHFRSLRVLLGEPVERRRPIGRKGSDRWPVRRNP